jgi:type IV pilus assembly protein PilQ
MKNKKNFLVIFLSTILFSLNSFAEKISAEFSGAKLSTVIDALSTLSKKNVMWDKNAVKYKDKIVYLNIQKPVKVETLFDIVLSENGLIYTKENNIITIKEADDFFTSVPAVVVKQIGKSTFDSLISIIKRNISPNAKLEINRDSYSVYVVDTKENIEKIKNYVNNYLTPLKKEALTLEKLEEAEKAKLARLQEEKQKIESLLIKKEIKIEPEYFKEIEDELIVKLSSFGKYSYNKKKHILTIIDVRENIPNLSKVIAKAQKIHIETKCFYSRALEPAELLLNIKERFLSKYGSIIFKSAKESEKVSGETVKLGGSSTTGGGRNISKQKTTEKIITSLPKICVTDKPEIVKKIKSAYSKVLLDRPYQVVIEARIVQIESSFKKELGIQWGINSTGSLGGGTFYNVSGSGLTGNYIFDFPAPSVVPGEGAAIGILLGSLTNNLDLRLSALETIGKSKILSRPKIITIDGEGAEISQGFEIPYISTGTAGGAAIANVQFKQALLKLNVIPRTTIDGNVIMNITLTQDIPDFKNTIAGNIPIQTKAIISKVVAKDGSTIVIGGILEKSNFTQDTGVPGLKNIPVIGKLFQNKTYNISNKELLIFLSPKIVYE